MLELKLPANVADIDLTSREFWSRPAPEREGAFELLRTLPGEGPSLLDRRQRLLPRHVAVIETLHE